MDNKNYTVNTIISDFGNSIIKIIGDANIVFFTFCSMNFPKKNAITWLGKKYYDNNTVNLSNLQPSVFIVDHSFDATDIKNKAFIVAEKPKLLFINILKKYFEKKYKYNIHPTAVISDEAIIEDNVYIGPNCIIGNCTIKSGTTLDGNNFIYDNVLIGKNVSIQAGAVIGSQGMSFASYADKNLIGFPSLGRVIVEDNVAIGSNAVIDCAVIDDTIIGKGTKINSSAFIGNSVCIGKNNYISVCVNINGSVVIGDENFIGSNSTIRNKITIGNNNTIGAGAVVVKPIKDNETVFGNPAKKQNIKGITL